MYFSQKKSINTRQFLNFKSIKKIRKFVNENINIDKQIIDQTESIYTKKFKNNKMIGVHFRGSDMKYTPIILFHHLFIKSQKALMSCC